MNLTQEMKEMLEVIKSYENKFRATKLNICYAPDIPDNISKALIKNFDINMPIKAVVAVLDNSLFGTGKEGVVFTTDGVYIKIPLFKADYVNYKDIEKIYYDKEAQRIKIDVKGAEQISKYTDEIYGNAFVDTVVKLILIDKEYGQTSTKQSGQIKPVDLPNDMLIKCHAIIHPASLGAGVVGAGLAQLPGSDNAVLLPIQVSMLIGLGAVFNLDIKEAGAKGLVLNYGASLAGRAASQYIVGWIPGYGNVINATTAASLTEAMGWLAVEDFYQRWLDDKSKGKLEGIKAGYAQASREFEQKFREQAKVFLKQKEIFKDQIDGFNELLRTYEDYIKELEGKVVASEILAEYESLKAMQPQSETTESKYTEDIDVESEYED